MILVRNQEASSVEPCQAYLDTALFARADPAMESSQLHLPIENYFLLFSLAFANPQRCRDFEQQLGALDAKTFALSSWFLYLLRRFKSDARNIVIEPATNVI